MSSVREIKKPTSSNAYKDLIFEELKKMLDEPKQDVIWEEKFKSKVKELLD